MPSSSHGLADSVRSLPQRFLWAYSLIIRRHRGRALHTSVPSSARPAAPGTIPDSSTPVAYQLCMQRLPVVPALSLSMPRLVSLLHLSFSLLHLSFTLVCCTCSPPGLLLLSAGSQANTVGMLPPSDSESGDEAPPPADGAEASASGADAPPPPKPAAPAPPPPAKPAPAKKPAAADSSSEETDSDESGSSYESDDEVPAPKAKAGPAAPAGATAKAAPRPAADYLSEQSARKPK